MWAKRSKEIKERKEMWAKRSKEIKERKEIKEMEEGKG